MKVYLDLSSDSRLWNNLSWKRLLYKPTCFSPPHCLLLFTLFLSTDGETFSKWRTKEAQISSSFSGKMCFKSKMAFMRKLNKVKNKETSLSPGNSPLIGFGATQGCYRRQICWEKQFCLSFYLNVGSQDIKVINIFNSYVSILCK